MDDSNSAEIDALFDRIKSLEGKYVSVSWTDEAGKPAGASGFLKELMIDDSGVWVVFDWGYAVATATDNFKIEGVPQS